MLLSVERKKSDHVDLAKPLERYVKATYDDKALADHQAAINALNTLRDDARRPDAPRETLVKYHTLLRSLELRFPIAESNIRVSFGWTDVLKGRKVALFSVLWERVNVLFNIGAACAGAAVATPMQSPDGPKVAAGLFQQACGTFSMLNELLSTHPDLQTQLPDLTPEYLRALSDAMLGNAQYCWFMKASKSSVSKSVLSKLAAQAAIFYGGAATTLQQSGPLREAVPKNWMAHLEALADLTRAEAAMLLSDELEQAMRYGERVARLAQATSLAEDARKKVAKISVPELKQYAESMAAQTTRDHAKALHENDTISHEQIPPVGSLTPLDARAMAKPADSPVVAAPEEDPFSDLVPFAVRQACAAYAERRDGMVQQETKTISDANDALKHVLSELNLPGALEALEAPEGLPPALQEKAKAVRAEGGARFVAELRDTLGKLAQTARELLTMAGRSLDEEEREDNELRTQHGARWTRTPSHTLTVALRQELAKHQQNMEHASKSDALVAGKWDRVAQAVTQLGKSDAEILAALPRSAAGGAASAAAAQRDPAVVAIKADLDVLNGVLAERMQANDALKAMAAQDNPSGALMLVASQPDPAAVEAVFQQQLAKYEQLLSTLRNGYARQAETLDKLRQDNTAFVALRQSTAGPRDSALQTFADAYAVYTEVCGNLREGVQFYTNFQEVLNRCKVKCEDFVLARRTEKEDLLDQVRSRGSSPAQPSYVPQQTSLYSAPPPPGAWQPTTAPQYATAAPPLPPKPLPQKPAEPQQKPYAAQQPPPPPQQPYPSQPPMPYAAQPGQPYPYGAPPSQPQPQYGQPQSQPPQYGQQPYAYQQQPPAMPYSGAPQYGQPQPQQPYGGYVQFQPPFPGQQPQPYPGQQPQPYPGQPNPYGGYGQPYPQYRPR